MHGNSKKMMANMANSTVGYNSSPTVAGLLCKVGSAIARYDTNDLSSYGFKNYENNNKCFK